MTANKGKLVFAGVFAFYLIGALTLETACKADEDREVVRLEPGGIRDSFFVPEVREGELSVLRGLKGVFVLVDEFCKGVKDSGVRETDILELVQKQLKKEAVKVLTRETLYRQPDGRAFL